MKTREEVLNHLLENGYTKNAINHILGFMVARELKTVDEKVKYLKGEGSFEDFFMWYNDCDAQKDEEESLDIEYCPQCVLNTLMEDIAKFIEFDIKAEEWELLDRHMAQMTFLLDLCGDEDED
jgi:hypothetical protein